MKPLKTVEKVNKKLEKINKSYYLRLDKIEQIFIEDDVVERWFLSCGENVDLKEFSVYVDIFSSKEIKTILYVKTLDLLEGGIFNG